MRREEHTIEICRAWARETAMKRTRKSRNRQRLLEKLRERIVLKRRESDSKSSKKKNILEKGGSAPPAELYQRFRGKDADPVEQRGKKRDAKSTHLTHGERRKEILTSTYQKIKGRRVLAKWR